MYSPLSAVMGRAPVTVPLEATIREALERMDRAGARAVIVADPGRRVPLGIFTLQDAVRRVTLPGGDLQQPIATVMTSGLITLEPHASAHQAALTMARNGVRHVVLVDAEERLVGVVSQEELFGLQRVGVRQIGADIEAARDVAALRGAALAIRGLAETLMAQAVGAETLTHYISTLNDLLTIRVIELAADGFDLPPVAMCWIALGSEGRLEQTFSTDQDNGLVFDAAGEDAEAVRSALLPFARKVNEDLDACGFPLCKGAVMAGNPQWCLTLDEWWQAISRWIHEPDPKALLSSVIAFDLRPIWGNEALVERLRDRLLAESADRPIFLRTMAAAALECQPPLGTIRDFVFARCDDFPHTLDLKHGGSRPFVDGARILALANRIPYTSTAQRLRTAAAALELGDGGVAAMIDGFHFIHLLRLRNQCRPASRPGGANRVDPRELNELDRQVLKEAFRQARKLQQRLVREYHLAT
jgi:CBS domain-containing protein